MKVTRVFLSEIACSTSWSGVVICLVIILATVVGQMTPINLILTDDFVWNSCAAKCTLAPQFLIKGIGLLLGRILDLLVLLVVEDAFATGVAVQGLAVLHLPRLVVVVVVNLLGLLVHRSWIGACSLDAMGATCICEVILKVRTISWDPLLAGQWVQLLSVSRHQTVLVLWVEVDLVFADNCWLVHLEVWSSVWAPWGVAQVVCKVYLVGVQ